MDDFTTQVYDMDTAKVIAAASVPFLLWGANLELALRIAGAAAAVLYIVVKTILLLINRKK
jgi:hypothetical protein